MLQSHRYSCGAAALATLMTLLGEITFEPDVLKLIFGEKLPLETDEQGETYLRALTLADLEKAARAKGFKVVSLKAHSGKEAIQTIQSLKPVIARLLLYGDTLHFCVVQEIQDFWVFISDPSYGNVKITLKQFYQAWDAGDRIILTISKYPFYAWVSTDGKKTYVKRNERDVIVFLDDITPVSLYQSVLQRISLVNNLGTK